MANRLDGLKLQEAAKFVRESVSETLAYYAFPREHWRQIRTNNPLERVLREDPPAHASRGGVPRRASGIDAGRGAAGVRIGQQMGHETLHGPAQTVRG